MRIMREHLFEVRDLAGGLSNSISRRYGVPTNHMPTAGLNMASNRITLALEIIEYYGHVFPRPTDPHSPPISDQNYERLIEVLNSCFVGVMSALESCSRKAAAVLPEVLGPPPGTLFNLIEKSASDSVGWISRPDEATWKRLIVLRNALVHNNGEFDRSDEFTLPGGYTWTFRPGEQAQVTLRHIPACLRWAVSSYGAWCIRYLEARSGGRNERT